MIDGEHSPVEHEGLIVDSADDNMNGVQKSNGTPHHLRLTMIRNADPSVEDVVAMSGSMLTDAQHKSEQRNPSENALEDSTEQGSKISIPPAASELVTIDVGPEFDEALARAEKFRRERPKEAALAEQWGQQLANAAARASACGSPRIQSGMSAPLVPGIGPSAPTRSVFAL